MKVLVLNFEYPPLGGGASPVCKRICQELFEKGHHVTVVTMGLDGLSDKELDNGITIHRIPVGRKEPNMSYPMEHLRFLRKGRSFLVQHLQIEKYDVVHCHFIISTGILARWVYKKYKIPFIITAHGSDLPNYNPDRFQLIHYITPYFIKRILTDCYSITTTSNFLATLIRPHLKENREVVVIPNGIDPASKIANKKKIILSTGRLLKRKGFQNLIEAVKDIESEYELHICGDGPEMKNLLALAKGSKTKIIFHGWIDNSSAHYKDLLKDAQIFSMVSEFENASVSLLEGMSNGCAVITSNQSGTAEMVADSGILLPPYDSESLRDCLLDLIGNKDKIKDLGAKAYQRVLDLYTWDKISHNYEELLLQTVSANKING